MDEELKKNMLKTGTSIVGIVCKDGIVIASDKQTTLGELMVANKDTLKIIKVNDYFVAAEAGVVSDTQLMIKLVRAELKLKELKSKSRPTIKEASNLMGMLVYNNIRKFSPILGITAFITAGIEEDGTFSLFSLDPTGAVTEVKDYYANGSGMTFIFGFLERKYKENLSIQEGVEIAIESLKSSTQRDLASGYGIDVFTITKEGIKQVVAQEIKPEYKQKKTT